MCLQIKLEYPHEVLTCISGCYGCISRDERPRVIKSLTFYLLKFLCEIVYAIVHRLCKNSLVYNHMKVHNMILQFMLNCIYTIYAIF